MDNKNVMDSNIENNNSTKEEQKSSNKNFGQSDSLIDYVSNLKERRKVLFWGFLITVFIVFLFVYSNFLSTNTITYLKEKDSSSTQISYFNNLNFDDVNYAETDLIDTSKDQNYAVNYSLDDSNNHILSNKIMFYVVRDSITSLISYKSYLYLDGKKVTSDDFNGMLSDNFYQELVNNDSNEYNMINFNLKSFYSLYTYKVISSDNVGCELILYYPFSSNIDKSAKLLILDSNNKLVFYKVLNDTKYSLNDELYGGNGFVKISDDLRSIYYIDSNNNESLISFVSSLYSTDNTLVS